MEWSQRKPNQESLSLTKTRRRGSIFAKKCVRTSPAGWAIPVKRQLAAATPANAAFG
jgi:hypothetical protein